MSDQHPDPHDPLFGDPAPRAASAHDDTAPIGAVEPEPAGGLIRNPWADAMSEAASDAVPAAPPQSPPQVSSGHATVAGAVSAPPPPQQAPHPAARYPAAPYPAAPYPPTPYPTAPYPAAPATEQASNYAGQHRGNPPGSYGAAPTQVGQAPGLAYQDPRYGASHPPATPPPLDRATRTTAPVARWLVPTTCVLALTLGTLGGFLGSALQRDGDQGSSASGPRTTSGVRPSPGSTSTYAPQQPPLAQNNGSVTAVADEVLPSTVQILAYDNASDREPAGTGSGFVLDADGHVVTNNHVVASTVDSGAVKVVDSDGNLLAAEVVGRSAVYDVAVVKVTDAADLKPAAMGNDGELRVGEQVVAIGAPLGLTQTVTSGIVSALRRPVSTGSAADDTSYISAVQTDAAINPGNSGGPLMNMKGQVIGVNSAIATTGSSGESGNIGVGFAIPIEQVRRTVDQILADGKAEFPVIGATVRPVQVSFNGAEITAIEPDSPAQKAGLRSGDRVTAVGDEKVSDGVGMIVAIRTHRPGETITLTRVRGNEATTITITLDARSG